MKTLYIVRHAKSDKDQEKLEDIDRPLNPRGYIDAHAMGSKLNDTRRKPELIVSSPAIRALTTALIFARKFNYDPKKIMLEHALYESSMKDYLKVIGELDNSFSSVMIFGHNSTITALVNSLTAPFTENVPTCGVTAILFTVNNWKEITKEPGKLVLYDFPKNPQR
ncbi:MAG: putative phosphohistidine phosphatase, SixA [Bacteroidetes bacterium]|nr:putative phosphohistidine phosphatase, SixA [Bacteroidota bacterium]